MAPRSSIPRTPTLDGTFEKGITMSDIPLLPNHQSGPKKLTPEQENQQLKKIIRELGLKVTQQRMDILRIVKAGDRHFTAQDIFEAVSETNTSIGFATVYRFLKALSAKAFVTEVRMGGMPARYEWSSQEHHDHLTCTVCGKVVEFENDEIEKLQEEVAKSLGFVLTDHILELFGVCSSSHCQKVYKSAPES